MKIIISPSKTMNYGGLEPAQKDRAWRESDLTLKLLGILKSLGEDDLKTLYKTSDKVVAEAIKINGEEKLYKAIDLFNGLVFKYIEYSSLDQGEKAYVDDKLLIFSALYGIIPACRPIKPYRLDLNNSLKPHIANLTRQWKPYVNEYIESLDTDLVVDLASTEYRKLLDIKEMKKNYVRIDFKDLKDGRYKSMATFSKMARGEFVRQMAVQGIKTLDEIKKVGVMGYRYDEDLSTETNLVFSRKEGELLKKLNE